MARQEEYFGMENIYFCKKCNNLMRFIHLDDGVTPMFILCDTLKCNEFAVSAMYKIPEWAKLHHKWFEGYHYEWYRPTIEEINQMPERERYHYLNGGCAKRPFRGFDIVEKL